MRLVLLGPPGAGKGSVAQLMQDRWRVAHIASGDLLREAVRARTPLGQQAQASMARGELVPDALVSQLVWERLRAVAGQGFVLDGFPRTRAQAEELDAVLARAGRPLDRVVYFRTSPAMIVQRLAGRRICRRCAANYHLTNMPPARDGLCDRCGGPLEQREDDRPETIARRLVVDEASTAPLVAYYRHEGRLQEVNGDESVEGLFQVLAGQYRRDGLVPPAG